MPQLNPLTPPSGGHLPDPLRNLAETRDPPTAVQSATPEDDALTLSAASVGAPTAPWAAGLAAAGHVPGYEILGLLGRGGMGLVYKARQVALDRIVALKLMVHGGLAGTAARDRFAVEARAVARMQHPNIVQVFEVGEVGGVPFLALEYVPGGTLADRISEHLLPPRDAAELVAALASAVQYAHDQGFIHRDIKPANVLLSGVKGQEPGVGKDKMPGGGPNLTPDSCPLTPKVSDFGLAKSLADDSGVTRSGAIVGTPSYMPPEQAGGGEVGTAADVYATGAVLYELLAGRPPFKGATVAETLDLVRTAEPVAPSALQPNVPRDLETICLKCLQKEPARRYASARDLGDDVRRYLDGRPIVARPVGAAERAWRWCRRNPAVASLLAVVMLLLATVAVGSSVAAVLVNEKRREVAHQRDQIADREREVSRQRGIAESRLRVYQKAVDGFVNEAPSIVEGHPLGSAPLNDLIDLGTRLLRDVQETGVDDSGLGKRGEMSALIRKGHLAKTLGRTDEAEKHYDDAFKMAEELLRTTSPEEKGKNTGNMALLVGQRAGMIRTRGEREAGQGDRAKGRESFAAAVKMHGEAIGMLRRLVAEPDMRDIPDGEAQCWLAGGVMDLAETHRRSVVAFEADADRRAAHEAARTAATEAEELYTAGLAAGGFTRGIERMRLRQATAVWDRAKAADTLGLTAEADAAYGRCFALFDQLVKDTPKNMYHRIEFSRLAAERSHFLMVRVNDPQRAAEACAAATAQSRRVGRPMELSYLAQELGGNLYRQGIAALGAGEPIKARDYFLLSVATHEETLREAVRVSSEKSLYTLNPRVRLMFAQARAGDHLAAAAFAAELRRDWDKDATKLNYAAQGFAICSLATDDTAEEETYRNRAFEALERALDAGYADAIEMANDPDYSALRDDPRFAPLHARARANAAAKK